MHKTLILWDIDGTLLHSSGAGMKALQRALEAVFGKAGSLEGIDFAGRTDRVIIRQIFNRFGIEHSDENFTRYVDGYVAALPGSLAASNAVVLPGIEEILNRAADHPDVVQGLLTGNLRRSAEIKLGYHDLWDYFPIGAFADDSEIRDDLGPHALARARSHWGISFAPEQVWIIGDTPHDVACARAFGARALAVATGSSSAATLAAHRPDAVLESLSDPGAFWSAIAP